VPYHHPQEMQQLLYNVNDVVSREKSFPLKLHSQRVASDKGMGEMASNYNDIIKMLESDIKDIVKVDDSTASAMREVVECLKDQFEQFRNLSLQNEATMSKNFAEYKDILTEQLVRSWLSSSLISITGCLSGVTILCNRRLACP
jgi:hypothetical protein